MSDHLNNPAIIPSVQSLRNHFTQRSLTGVKPNQINNSDSLAFKALHKKNAIRAAVLIPVIVWEDDLSVLLTRRADHLRSHPGEVSFPGGRIEEVDNSTIETAIREAEEEIGLPPQNVEILGPLGDYYTLHGVCITPIVGLINQPFTWVADPEEVADIFQVPLQYILDPKVYDTREHQHEGILRRYYSTIYKQHHIWGVTAGIIMGLHHELLTTHL